MRRVNWVGVTVVVCFFAFLGWVEYLDYEQAKPRQCAGEGER